MITEQTFDFLNALEKNNNREWFAEHKKEFKKHEVGIKSFMMDLQERMKQHDDIEKSKLFRIYRDVRFSKNKQPYKTHFAGSFSRASARLRGGYYLQVKPGGSFIATGFWQPNKEDLLRIRKEFETDATAIRNVINEKSFTKVWGELMGDEVKTAPKGFDREDLNIDLIRKKQFIFVRNFTDKEVLSPDFMDKIDDSFRKIRPYFDLMSDILTTNLNGEPTL